MMQEMMNLWNSFRKPENLERKKSLSDGALFWTLAFAIPVVTIISTHLLLRSGYTGDVFHLQGFLDQYNAGIFRYRILGRELLLFVYRHLTSRFPDKPFPMLRDPNATLLFYLSNVAINAVSFFFSNLMLLWLLSSQKSVITDVHLVQYFFLTLLQALAMAVVTPYDQLTYVFLFVAFLGATASNQWITYLLLGIAAIAGGLNRETEFLVTPALLSIGFFLRGEASRRYVAAGCYHLVLFACTYVGLRIFIPTSHIISGGVTMGGKWAWSSGLVLALLFYVGTAISIRLYNSLRPTIVLLILCAPYLVTILLSGALRELRLLNPILICQMFVYLQLQGFRAKADC